MYTNNLNVNHEQLNRILDTIPESIGLANIENETTFRFIFVNKTTTTQLGFPPESILGKTFQEIAVNPEAAARALKKAQEAIQTRQPIQFEDTYMLPNGEFIVRNIFTPITDDQNNVTQILTITKDITQEKQAQKTLQQSEKRFRALIEKCHDIIELVSPEGKVTFVSDSIVNTMGYTSAEWMQLDMMAPIHPDDIPEMGQEFTKLMSHPGGTITKIARLKHKDGSWKTVEAIITNLIQDQNIQAILVNFHDITDQRTAELALKERTDELEKMNKLIMGREQKMIQLKEQLAQLEGQLKQKEAT